MKLIASKKDLLTSCDELAFPYVIKLNLLYSPSQSVIFFVGNFINNFPLSHSTILCHSLDTTFALNCVLHHCAHALSRTT